jgi:hypothetical protein
MTAANTSGSGERATANESSGSESRVPESYLSSSGPPNSESSGAVEGPAATGGRSTSSSSYRVADSGAATLADLSDAERASFWKAAAKMYRDRALAAVRRQLELRHELERERNG